MSNLVVISFPVCPQCTSTSISTKKFLPPPPPPSKLKLSTTHVTRAFFFNPSDEPILKEAIKEPVAFMGGIFAGLLRLDLNEEPLKQWINRTVEASGITEQEIDNQGPNTEEAAPQQINIE